MQQQLSFNESNNKKDDMKKGNKNNHKYKVAINDSNDIDYEYFLDYDKAKEYCEKKDKKTDDKVNVGIVYKEPQPLPDDKRSLNGGKVWCPFCNTHREFNSSGKKVDTCNYCGISKKNYYVKKENELWNRE